MKLEWIPKTGLEFLSSLMNENYLTSKDRKVCRKRWMLSSNENRVVGKFTEAEVNLLTSIMNGVENKCDWVSIAKLYNERKSAGMGERDNLQLSKKAKTLGRGQKRQWTEDEEDLLESVISEVDNTHDWVTISKLYNERKREDMTTRDNVHCLGKWRSIKNKEKVLGPWREDEESLLLSIMNEIQDKSNWVAITKLYNERKTDEMGDRDRNQIYQKWTSNLDPSLKSTPFTEEENEIIWSEYKKGNWSRIGKLLGGRCWLQVRHQFDKLVRAKHKKVFPCGLLVKRFLLQSSQPASLTTITEALGDIKNIDPEEIRAIVSRYLSGAVTGSVILATTVEGITMYELSNKTKWAKSVLKTVVERKRKRLSVPEDAVERVTNMKKLCLEKMLQFERERALGVDWPIMEDKIIYKNKQNNRYDIRVCTADDFRLPSVVRRRKRRRRNQIETEDTKEYLSFIYCGSYDKSPKKQLGWSSLPTVYHRFFRMLDDTLKGLGCGSVNVNTITRKLTFLMDQLTEMLWCQREEILDKFGKMKKTVEVEKAVKFFCISVSKNVGNFRRLDMRRFDKITNQCKLYILETLVLNGIQLNDLGRKMQEQIQGSPNVETDDDEMQVEDQEEEEEEALDLQQFIMRNQRREEENEEAFLAQLDRENAAQLRQDDPLG